MPKLRAMIDKMRAAAISQPAQRGAILSRYRTGMLAATMASLFGNDDGVVMPDRISPEKSGRAQSNESEIGFSLARRRAPLTSPRTPRRSPQMPGSRRRG